MAMNDTQNDAAALARGVAQAIREDRLDDAEAALQELTALHGSRDELLVFPVLIAVQRGHAREALHYVYSLGPDRCPELKALCLYLLRDPLWQGEAAALVDSPVPHVRQAMRLLLGLPIHDERNDEPGAVAASGAGSAWQAA